MKEAEQFKLFDIPVLCSVFMPAAFEYYADVLPPIPDGVKHYYSEWVKVLPEVLQKPCFRDFVGDKGYNAMKFGANPVFTERCVSSQQDIGYQSLYNALRNTETLNYLMEKNVANLRFVDVGSGFCPLSAALQNEYNLSDVYIIDKQPILDAYEMTANIVGGKSPVCIDWDTAKEKIQNQQINTVVAMGLFPYLPLAEQIDRLMFINQYCQNIFIEIKYNSKRNLATSQFFSSDSLVQLRSSLGQSKELEKHTRHKTLEYYRRFCELSKNRFRQKEFSLFICR
ncbi:MAG: hypothetical protein KBS86_02410 [Proteobacteria bacterium]|nr:hypothetical protein [Candidatus Enterousia scatequi]